MTHEEAFKEAFGYLRRYELYRLLHAVGLLIIYCGISYFLTSWVVMLPLRELLTHLFRLLDLPCAEISDECEVQAFLITMNIQVTILVILVIILFVIMLPVALSLSKTSTKNHTIASRRLIIFISIIFFLFFTTFHNLIIDQIMWRLILWSLQTAMPYTHPSVWFFGYYWGATLTFLPILFWPMLGVGIILYLLRRKFPKFDFREIRIFGHILVILCVIDIGFRTIYQVVVLPFVFNPVMIVWLSPFGQFYWVFNWIIIGTYIVFGWLLVQRANQVLEAPFT